MAVGDQLVTVTSIPLNVTVLAFCAGPKFVPLIVTAIPIPPLLGLNEVMVGVGGGVMVNGLELLFPPGNSKNTVPVTAPAGTATIICVLL